MPPQKSNFLDKVLGRVNRLDPDGLQSVVQRLARERTPIPNDRAVASSTCPPGLSDGWSGLSNDADAESAAG